jgi:ADP-heptose:LPS heptosyltransferase
VGDALLTTPVLAALKEKDHSRRIVVYCRSLLHKTVFENNPNVDSLKSPSFLTKVWVGIFRRFKLGPIYIPNYGQFLPSLFCNKKAAELIAEQIFNIELNGKKVDIYLTPGEEEKAKSILARHKNPIVLHIIPMGSSNKMWLPMHWEALVRSMPDHTFLQIGLPNEAKVESAVDLRGKVSFREALALIKHADSFLGIDSSFAHATNAFNIPGVVLFGATNPEIWGHPNNINLYKRLRCSPCIDLLYNSRCPYNQLCMAQITVEEVKGALIEQTQKRAKQIKMTVYEN